MSGVVLLPWYATLFRGDDMERALAEIAPVAMRYGALEYDVLRSHGDTYKFAHYSTWDEHIQFEAYWYGSEFRLWRSDNHRRAAARVGCSCIVSVSPNNHARAGDGYRVTYPLSGLV